MMGYAILALSVIFAAVAAYFSLRRPRVKVTLADPEQVLNFERGMTTMGPFGAPCVVTRINRRRGTMIMRLLALFLLLATRPAWADPPPAAVAEPTLTVKRRTYELLVAEAEAAPATRAELAQCREDILTVKKVEKPEGRLWFGVKVAGVTALVMGAFVAGLMIGR